MAEFPFNSLPIVQDVFCTSSLYCHTGKNRTALKLRMQAADAEFAHLLQRAFDLGVEGATRVLFPDSLLEVPLHAAELLVAVGRKVRLQSDLF